MDDLAAEARYQKACGTDWELPVRDTHTFGGLTVVAATDYGHCYATLFEGDRVPVYGYLALARAGLEACVVSRWLNDPRIDTEERVKRGLCEQLYSTWEVLRLDLDDPSKAMDNDAAWRRCATTLGWAVEKDRTGKPIVGGARRPNIAQQISELVVGRGDRPLGRALVSYLSAVIHVTWYGLRPGVVEPPKADALGPSLAMVGTDSKTVNPQSYGLLRAIRQAGAARQTLMGWNDDEVWKNAAAQSEAHEAVLLERIVQSAK
jgi:hypothetical protein